MNWGEPPNDIAPGLLPAQSKFYGLWPSPIHKCECLRKAHVTDFLVFPKDDQEMMDSWEKEWQDLLNRSLDVFSDYGAPKLREEVKSHEVVHHSFIRKWIFKEPCTRPVDLSLMDQLLLVTMDDSFGAVTLDFGEDKEVAMRTGYGHTILWVAATQEAHFDFHSVLARIASSHKISMERLKWEHIL